MRYEPQNGAALRILNTIMLAMTVGGMAWVGNTLLDTKERLIRLEASDQFILQRLTALEQHAKMP